MNTLFIVPEQQMRRKLEQHPKLHVPPSDVSLQDILAKKEIPEAYQVVSLDRLTAETLSRSDLSEWQKAEMLSNNLQRFIALKPLAFPDSAKTEQTPIKTPELLEEPSVIPPPLLQSSSLTPSKKNFPKSSLSYTPYHTARSKVLKHRTSHAARVPKVRVSSLNDALAIIKIKTTKKVRARPRLLYAEQDLIPRVIRATRKHKLAEAATAPVPSTSAIIPDSESDSNQKGSGTLIVHPSIQGYPSKRTRWLII